MSKAKVTITLEQDTLDSTRYHVVKVTNAVHVKIGQEATEQQVTGWITKGYTVHVARRKF